MPLRSPITLFDNIDIRSVGALSQVVDIEQDFQRVFIVVTPSAGYTGDPNDFGGFVLEESLDAAFTPDLRLSTLGSFGPQYISGTSNPPQYTRQLVELDPRYRFFVRARITSNLDPGYALPLSGTITAKLYFA